MTALERLIWTGGSWESEKPPAAHRQGAALAPLHTGDALSRLARSCQFGRTSAPVMPQQVQTIRGPKDGAGTLGPWVDAQYSRMMTSRRRTSAAG
jgi:hypothetical protein